MKRIVLKAGYFQKKKFHFDGVIGWADLKE